MTEEQYCYQMLAELRKSYERDAKPWIDKLVALRSINPSPQVALTIDQAREFIGFSMSARDAGQD